MDELIRLACDLLDVDTEDVLSSKVYDDQVVFVVRQGYKFFIPRDDLAIPEPVEVIATTEARAYAKMHGVDLSTIQGSGRGGRILVRDVREAINGSTGKTL
jgi:pyruvate/2-oxoglutarate dehydrogenase complex dihydrolipoamide acyltransferase (E2) component